MTARIPFEYLMRHLWLVASENSVGLERHLLEVLGSTDSTRSGLPSFTDGTHSSVFRGVCRVFKVVWYPKMDQKVCLNMVKKYQLCGTALKKRN